MPLCFLHLSSQVLLLCACMVLLGEMLWWKKHSDFFVVSFSQCDASKHSNYISERAVQPPVPPPWQCHFLRLPQSSCQFSPGTVPHPNTHLCCDSGSSDTSHENSDLLCRHTQTNFLWAKDLCTYRFVFSNEISCSLLATYCDLNVFVCSVTQYWLKSRKMICEKS